MNLELRNLTKCYGSKTAVDHLNLTITPGVWGLLGANGAGKTTLLRMLTGILKPTSGQICYDGVDIQILDASYRDLLGYLPQDFGFYPEFTVMDYLEYVATLKGLSKSDYRARIDSLLELLTLTDVCGKSIRNLSGGMQRRVGIAQALLNDPDILILDEPTSGLDPGERVRFRNLISDLAQDKMILISTHIVSDVEYIAVRNAIMKDGSIIDVGTTEDLLKTVEHKVYTAVIPQHELLYYEKTARIVSIKHEGAQHVVVRYLSDTPVIPNSQAAEPRLEDLYLWLFRQESADGRCWDADC